MTARYASLSFLSLLILATLLGCSSAPNEADLTKAIEEFVESGQVLPPWTVPRKSYPSIRRVRSNQRR